MCLAIPGCIERVDDSAGPLARTAAVRFGPMLKTVNVSLVPEADVGDYVLVHVGVAIQRIDAEEAKQVLALLAELDGSTS